MPSRIKHKSGIHNQAVKASFMGKTNLDDAVSKLIKSLREKEGKRSPMPDCMEVIIYTAR